MRYNVNILQIPASALVVLIGAAASGKSTFARAHFRPTEILSSDYFRALVSDDEANQEATNDAFELLHCALEKRLRRGKLCVVDATNVRAVDRQRMLDRAKRLHRPAVAIILDVPESVALERAASRSQRFVHPEIIKQQVADLKQSLAAIGQEGFHQIFTLPATGEIQVSRFDC